MAEQPPGMGVDASGGPVIDPTRNVLDKVEDAVKRLDDLREAAERLSNVKHAHIKEVAELRAAHARELNEAETKRIDAIRTVDVNAVAIAAERTAQAANVLATQVSQSAETLRALVATTAAASQQQGTATFGQLSDRITLLERTSYEGSGKSAGVGLSFAALIQTISSVGVLLGVFYLILGGAGQ
jgi:type II secretory pathway component GspD/PulD (secretin)